MKIFFILLPLLFSISFYAQDAELLKKIGARKDKDGNILLGKAFIRKDDRSISFPGRINVREGVIEVLVSTPRGRMHESLIVTELDPLQLQMALILAGYDNGDITRGAPFHIEIIYGKSRRINVDEWLYDSTAGKPKEKGTYVFVGSSFKDKQCLASLEGNLININSLDKNTILNAALSPKSALHEYIVRKEKMPEAGLKNIESPLEGYEETPVRVILVPVANPADTGKNGKREMAPAEGPKTK